MLATLKDGEANLTTFEYDGSFRERVCELAMPGSASAEFFMYG